jgi:hypothetical protein
MVAVGDDRQFAQIVMLSTANTATSTPAATIAAISAHLHFATNPRFARARGLRHRTEGRRTPDEPMYPQGRMTLSGARLWECRRSLQA